MDSRPPTVQSADEVGLRLREVHEKYRTIRTGLRVAGSAAMFYFAAQAFEAAAGQNTNITIAFSLIFKAFFELKFALAIALATACAAWALGERLLRYRKVEQMQARIKALEISFDPQRTSSNLTIEGKTNPRDRGD